MFLILPRCFFNSSTSTGQVQGQFFHPKIVESKPKASKPEESNCEVPTSQPVQSKFVQPRPKASKLVVPLSDRVLRKAVSVPLIICFFTDFFMIYF